LLRNPIAGLVIAVLLSASMWFYVQYVLIPYQRADAAAHDRPRGNLSDLYPRWLGARELLLHHRDPYNSDVTREIQSGYYGRPLDPSRVEDPKDQQGFAYPVYVVFLLAPTITLPFSAVEAGFRWLLLIITIATVPAWLRALRWRPSITTTATLILLTIGSFPAVQGIKLQQLSLVVSGLIALCVLLLTSANFLSAGVILAFATIKPQLVWPLAAWLIVWTVSDWRQRQRFVWGFGVTLTALLGAAEYLLPGWLAKFRHAITAYRQYTGGAGSLLDVLVTPGWGRVISGLILSALAVVCWRLRREQAGTAAFSLATAVVLAATVVIVPMVAPYNQLLLLPCVFVLIQQARSNWNRSRLTRLAYIISVLLVLWPWLAALCLSVAELILPQASVQMAWALPLYTSLGIPLALLGTAALALPDLVSFNRGQRSTIRQI
jgi:glycosyl transferase family 87